MKIKKMLLSLLVLFLISSNLILAQTNQQNFVKIDKENNKIIFYNQQNQIIKTVNTTNEINEINLTFSNNDNYVAITTAKIENESVKNSLLRVFNKSGILIWSQKNIPIGYLKISPDGRLVVAANWYGNDLYLFRSDHQETKIITNANSPYNGPLKFIDYNKFIATIHHEDQDNSSKNYIDSFYTEVNIYDGLGNLLWSKKISDKLTYLQKDDISFKINNGVIILKYNNKEFNTKLRINCPLYKIKGCNYNETLIKIDNHDFLGCKISKCIVKPKPQSIKFDIQKIMPIVTLILGTDNEELKNLLLTILIQIIKG